jgi:hypothetical protein
MKIINVLGADWSTPLPFLSLIMLFVLGLDFRLKLYKKILQLCV